MTFVKTHFKLILTIIICLVWLTIFLWYPQIENIPIKYPNHSFYTGQSLTEIKSILGDSVSEPDNAGKRNYRYIVFNDTTTNPKIRIHSFLTFYKNHLVSFYSQFKLKDSTFNLSDWLKGEYVKTINNNDYRSFFKDGKFQYKSHKNNSFIHLTIDKEYSKFSASTYLAGDIGIKNLVGMTNSTTANKRLSAMLADTSHLIICNSVYL